MRVKITLNYNGSGFVGWQRQIGGGSIQDCIENAVFRLTGERVTLFGSGRTDAGVHALNQTAHFDINKIFDVQRVAPGLNFYLPETVRVQNAEEVSEEFHARKSVKRKTYIYIMYKSKSENALLSGRALKIEPETNVQLMREAAAQFVGRHDFFAFMSTGSSAKTTVRTVFDSEIIIPASEQISSNGLITKAEQTSFGSLTPPLIIYKITADGFLYNMVRKITACILRAGLNKVAPSDIPSLIEKKDRNLCKDLAKPHGLYLYSVEY